MTEYNIDQEAAIAVLRGVLAVESGHIRKADDCFHQALDFWDSTSGRFFDTLEAQYGRVIATQSLRTMGSRSP